MNLHKSGLILSNAGYLSYTGKIDWLSMKFII